MPTNAVSSPVAVPLQPEATPNGPDFYRAWRTVSSLLTTLQQQLYALQGYINGSPQLTQHTGTNAPMGTAVMVLGTVTVFNGLVTAKTRIFLTAQDAGSGNTGAVYISARSAGTSFTITSTNGADTSTVAYLLVEPA